MRNSPMECVIVLSCERSKDAGLDYYLVIEEGGHGYEQYEVDALRFLMLSGGGSWLEYRNHFDGRSYGPRTVSDLVDGGPTATRTIYGE